ncbi:hypothetical protein [Acetatifactor aquisgranensis]|uniref:hypothetical protein n=1 Tax=Acetatifactor aquisgranensis TaxID=2941233 RepID=UPI00203FC618|nr:hypothetical protein [Acetatifactor aquisgranensis]
MYPVQMVSGVSKPRREHEGSRQRDSRSSKPAAFSAILEETAPENCPSECYIVTYDRQSRLRTYSYQQSREYTF